MRFSFLSTHAEIRPITDRVKQIEFYGPLCKASFLHLAPQVLAVVSEADGLIIRMDKALMLLAVVPDLPNGIQGSRPAAIIAREGLDFELWASYCRRAADAGIMRCAFLPSQLLLATLWLAHQYSAKSARWPRLPDSGRQPV